MLDDRFSDQPSPPRGPSCALVVALSLLASCGFGHGVVRPDAQTVIENRGMNRYVYRFMRTASSAPRGPATPWVGFPPTGSREVGAIFASVRMSGWGAEGYRWSERDFYPVLAAYASEMDGTHFGIVRVVRDRYGWLRQVTVSVTVADDVIALDDVTTTTR